MAKVLALSISNVHQFTKSNVAEIELVMGEGIIGDAHRGASVKHLSRVKVNPNQPNLRQVHLIHNELLEELRDKGFNLVPGTLGENITTQGIDLLSLPTNTLLLIGDQVVLRVTGLRNPCAQLNNYQSGLMSAVLGKDDKGHLIRKAGVMAIVEEGGFTRIEDNIQIQYPAKPYLCLDRV